MNASSSHRTRANASEPKVVAIPEPIHRLEPTTSGISLRPSDIPRASSERIVETCKLYEAKCSGKYASDSLAARYVFLLSREVQEQVRIMREDIRRRDERIKFLETCASEWDSVFGPRSLTPRQLQDSLDELSAKVAALEDMLASRQARHEKEIQELEGAMSEHYAAARDDHRAEMERVQARMARLMSQMNEEHSSASQKAEKAWRETISKALTQQQAQFESAIEEEREKTRDAETRLGEAKEAQDRIMLEDYEKYETAIENELRMARERHDDELVELQDTLSSWERQRVEAEEHREAKHKHEMAAMQERLLETTREDRKRAADLSTENQYLRKRVKDLNRLLRAFSNAVA